MAERVLIGIAGGSGAGKTALAEALHERLQPERSVLLPLDCYYCDLSALAVMDRDAANFDVPGALDWELVVRHLLTLAAGESIHRPVYDFARHARREETERVEARQVIVVEGLFALHHPQVRNCLDAKVFVDLEDDKRLRRRMRRDIAERGRSASSVARQYELTVRPAFEKHILPTRVHADLVVSGDADLRSTVSDVLATVLPANTVAADVP